MREILLIGFGMSLGALLVVGKYKNAELKKENEYLKRSNPAEKSS